MSLGDVLKSYSDYSVALAPGFFRKFAYVGALSAIEEAGHLNIVSAAGASAGAIVTAFLGAGYSAKEMTETLFELKREDFWDMDLSLSVFSGLLKGNKMQKTFESRLKGLHFMEDCNIPIGVTAYDVFRCKTRVLQKGPLSRMVSASCSVPVMFQPVSIEGSPHYDGGIFDQAGIMALQLPKGARAEKEQLVLNFMCDRSQVNASILPPCFPDNTRLITIVLENVPPVTPFSMSSSGLLAHSHAKRGLAKALARGLLEEIDARHSVVYIDCSM